MEKPHTQNHSHGHYSRLHPAAGDGRTASPTGPRPDPTLPEGWPPTGGGQDSAGPEQRQPRGPPGAPWTGGPGAWTCPPRSDGAAPGEGAAGTVPLPSSPPALSHAIP